VGHQILVRTLDDVPNDPQGFFRLVSIHRAAPGEPPYLFGSGQDFLYEISMNICQAEVAPLKLIG
jgi:hypothetical protein